MWSKEDDGDEAGASRPSFSVAEAKQSSLETTVSVERVTNEGEVGAYG